MPRFLVHSVQMFDLLKVIEADTAEQAETMAETFIFEEYQREVGETIRSISEVPDDYDLHEDAHSKGFV